MKVNNRSHTGPNFGIPCKNICFNEINENKKEKDYYWGIVILFVL